MTKKVDRKPLLGILEWFHQEDKEHVEKVLHQMEEIGIRELRTGISWADFHAEGGVAWLDWLIPKLAEKVKILPCLLYTPPSIGLVPKTSSPPLYPEYYAHFVQTIIKKYGQHFEWIELWNEPNNTSEYDYRLDPDWSVFQKMISWAAKEANSFDKKVLLGGMSPIDPNWLSHMYRIGLMEQVDALGIHGFPDTFDSNWMGWEHNLHNVRQVIKAHKGQQKVWITETGFSTWQHDEVKQLHQFMQVLDTDVERVYWYSLNDLSSSYATVDGFHHDEREYAFGMADENGREKLLYRLLSAYGKEHLDEFTWLTHSFEGQPKREETLLITGGAGFVGTNLASYFIEKNKKVIILDNLNRPGVEKNLRWLREHYPDELIVEVADIRNPYAVKKAVDQSHFVFHLAAQVAVTISCEQPVMDFQTNLQGTINLLEAIRQSEHQPPIIFTSTNKVYGNLDHMQISENGSRYELPDHQNGGIPESQPLDFHSPYGCSKGSADAYILDYARTYGLKAVVFRMSCIFGPHQMGTEDQGWVAHFLLQAMKGEKISIYGNGKQVRDVLYVGDLVEAFHLAYEQIDKLSGQAFNIGGGIQNSTSLIELIGKLENQLEEKIEVEFHPWRTGDQRYYVSDTSAFEQASGWKRQVDLDQGLNKLYQWMSQAQQHLQKENLLTV
ncbi:MAG: GDP-mannose 4,6-dehydratase [Cyclobacteriaceae bacterium]